jgi:integrase/recombinase XerD
LIILCAHYSTGPEEKQPSPFGELLCDYHLYLTEVRGFKATTISQHLSTIERFLSEALPPNSPLDSISLQIVEAFIVVTGQRMIRQSLQHIVAHLRSFLRFCYDQKALSRRLDTIDSPRTY